MKPATAQLIIRLSLSGLSVRAIARRVSIPKSTVQDAIARHRSSGGSAGRQGTFLVLDEYLQRGRLSPSQRSEVAAWMAENEGRIFAADESSDRRVMTFAAERNLARQECGPRGDWRENLKKGLNDAA